MRAKSRELFGQEQRQKETNEIFLLSEARWDKLDPQVTRGDNTVWFGRAQRFYSAESKTRFGSLETQVFATTRDGPSGSFTTSCDLTGLNKSCPLPQAFPTYQQRLIKQDQSKRVLRANLSNRVRTAAFRPLDPSQHPRELFPPRRRKEVWTVESTSRLVISCPSQGQKTSCRRLKRKWRRCCKLNLGSAGLVELESYTGTPRPEQSHLSTPWRGADLKPLRNHGAKSLVRDGNGVWEDNKTWGVEGLGCEDRVFWLFTTVSDILWEKWTHSGGGQSRELKTSVLITGRLSQLSCLAAPCSKTEPVGLAWDTGLKLSYRSKLNVCLLDEITKADNPQDANHTAQFLETPVNWPRLAMRPRVAQVRTCTPGGRLRLYRLIRNVAIKSRAFSRSKSLITGSAECGVWSVEWGITADPSRGEIARARYEKLAPDPISSVWSRNWRQ
ncbi:hypothetical protein RRG08_020835 [Elysia crispata]|uniref:Uncharacterized protein n=1 Tax=Elysia crispata TaxID=231223 RepID=A0AAE1CMH2_9GAST|nr:hypothetical protein RRG08_020835 [Elysia crispata]